MPRRSIQQCLTLALVLPALGALTACNIATTELAPTESQSAGTSASQSAGNSAEPSAGQSLRPNAKPTPSAPTTTPPSPPPPEPAPLEPAPPELDPRNRFYFPDQRWRTSPWFEGQGRVMIGFGCTEAPWYDASAKCGGDAGFHHGIDVAVPCGTPLRSAVGGTIIGPGGSTRLGSAYGAKAFRIRDDASGRDIVIAHAQQVQVSSGTTVRPGQQIALAGADGAPDGCHLHLEVRPAGGGVSSAVDPSEVLQLTPA